MIANLFRSLVSIVLLVFAVLASSALYAYEEAQPVVKFAFIGKDASSPTTAPVRAGAMGAAADLSNRLNVEIEILDWTPASATAAEQADRLRDAYVEGVAGVFLHCNDALGLSPIIDFLAENGIPVVTFGADAPTSQRIASVVSDEVEIGRMMVRETVQAMGHRIGGVAIIAGNMGREQNLQRLKGVMQEMEMRQIPVYGVYPCREDAAAIETVRAVEQGDRNKGIRGWIFLSGWPLQSGSQLPWSRGYFSVVSGDVLPVYLSYLSRQEVTALITIDLYDMGYEGLRTLAEQALEGRAPESVEIHIEPLIITPANLSEHQGNWTEWLR